MDDPDGITMELTAIIARLDPRDDDIAICHLRDAIAALEAVHQGRSTQYGRYDVIRAGRVQPRDSHASKIRAKVRTIR